jgi:hypothetical protein
MCVAAVCFGDTPPLEYLEDMELGNPHGAGVAWVRNGAVAFVKGLDAEEVHYALSRVPRPALFHFRWASAGPKTKRLTHPFPLGVKALTHTGVDGVAPAVMIHNGTWSSWRQHIPQWAKKDEGNLSDTAVAAYMAEDHEDILDSVHWATAILRSDKRVTLRGDWHNHGGTLYSNMHWLDSKSRWKWMEG